MTFGFTSGPFPSSKYVSISSRPLLVFDRRRIRYAKPARRAKPTGTPTPRPTPMATWLVLGCETEEGVGTVVEGEIKPPDEVDGVEDVGTRELVEEKTLVVVLVVGVLLIPSDPKLVFIMAGPEPSVNSRDWVEQHPESDDT